MTTTVKQQDQQRSEEEARAQLAFIVEMIERLRHAREFDGAQHLDECELSRETILGGVNVYLGEISEQEFEGYKTQYHDCEDAERRVQEDPLSVEVRSEWYMLGSGQDDRGEPGEYRILLCTGGPAVQIVGDLDGGEVTSARLLHQDWYEPWTEIIELSEEEREALLEYARCFYFGE